MPTYTTSAELYRFDADAVIEPEEVLAAYGRPLERTHGLSREDMHDLVGNSMAAQPLASVLMAIAFEAGLPGLWEKSAATTRAS